MRMSKRKKVRRADTRAVPNAVTGRRTRRSKLGSCHLTRERHARRWLLAREPVRLSPIWFPHKGLQGP